MSRDAIREEDFDEVLVSVDGNFFKTMLHRFEKYYVCPICGIGDMEPIFFSETDIVRHIKHHLRQKASPTKER